ncbi:MAG: hypothetical protein Q8W44_04740 [Candidatus Palauibacterales bacterium]|nr:hypothetical protein [Candidatus Palauibacterales bacterium]
MTETATDGARILRRLLSIGTALAAALALVGLTACESSTGPDGSASVSIGFRAASGGSASASVADAGVDGSSGSGVSPAIEFSGSNGTLSIDEAHLVVTEFEVSRADVDCDDEGSAEECEEFETGPQFIGLPLEGGTTVTVSQQVPAGTYEEVDFEIDDLEADDDDDEDGEEQAQQELLQQIRSQFSEWPENASVRVAGTFTPASDNTEPRDFTAYFEAEIEVEKEFADPLVIEGDGDDKSVTLTVDPAVWFELPDGTVADLSQLDYGSTGQVVEIEFELENGFTEAEVEG